MSCMPCSRDCLPSISHFFLLAILLIVGAACASDSTSGEVSSPPPAAGEDIGGDLSAPDISNRPAGDDDMDMASAAEFGTDADMPEPVDMGTGETTPCAEEHNVRMAYSFNGAEYIAVVRCDGRLEIYDKEGRFQTELFGPDSGVIDIGFIREGVVSNELIALDDEGVAHRFIGQRDPGQPSRLIFSSERVERPPFTDIIDITTGDTHGCLLRPAGLWCWGRNDQSAYQYNAPGAEFNHGDEAPTQVWAGSGEAVVAGGHSTCVVTSERELRCTGNITSPVPNLDYDDPGLVSEPVARAWANGGEPFGEICVTNDADVLTCSVSQFTLPEDAAAKDAVLDENSSIDWVCWLTPAGDISCAGEHYDSDAGMYVPATSPSPQPERVIALIPNTSCALIARGEVMCWGAAFKAQDTSWTSTPRTLDLERP